MSGGHAACMAGPAGGAVAPGESRQPGAAMQKVRDAQALLLDCVRDLYEAETQAQERTPALLDSVADPELRAAIESHVAATHGQAARLEAVAGFLGESASGPESLWAGGILDDAERDTKTVEAGPLLDIALIGALRKLESAEVVSYETAVGVARVLGLARAVPLLERTHAEERAMDARLAGLLERLASGVGAAK